MGNFKNKILLALGISLLVVVVLTFFTVDENTWETMKGIRLFDLLIILGIVVLCWTFNGLKLKILAAGVGFQLPLLTAVEVGLVDRFFSNITPSGIGGQPVKIMALAKSHISSGKASAIVVVELLLRLSFFLFSLPIVVYKLYDLFMSYQGIELFFVMFPLIMVGLIAVVYLLLYKPRWLVIAFFWLLNRKIMVKLISEEKRYAWKRAWAREIHIFHENVWLYLDDSVWYLLSAFLVTVLLWVTRFTILYFVIQGLNLEADLMFLFLIQLFLYVIVIFIPVPGGSGVEAILAFLLQGVIPTSIIGIVVALWRFFMYYVYIIAGGLVSVKVFHLQDEIVEQAE